MYLVPFPQFEAFKLPWRWVLLRNRELCHSTWRRPHMHACSCHCNIRPQRNFCGQPNTAKQRSSIAMSVLVENIIKWLMERSMQTAAWWVFSSLLFSSMMALELRAPPSKRPTEELFRVDSRHKKRDATISIFKTPAFVCSSASWAASTANCKLQTTNCKQASKALKSFDLGRRRYRAQTASHPWKKVSNKVK